MKQQNAAAVVAVDTKETFVATEQMVRSHTQLMASTAQAAAVLSTCMDEEQEIYESLHRGMGSILQYRAEITRTIKLARKIGRAHRFESVMEGCADGPAFVISTTIMPTAEQRGAAEHHS